MLDQAPSRSSRRSIRALAAVAVMGILLGLSTVILNAPARAAQSANLIVNPGSETGECSLNGQQGATLPGWTISSGMPTIVCYGTSGGWPSTSTPGASTGGRAFFTGGATGNSGMYQTVDLSAAASSIDGGGVTYNLSGLLGGYGSQNDRAGVVATFLDAAGSSLGSAQLAAVTNTDRGNTTEFLQRTSTGTIPVRTRSVKVEIDYTWTGGSTTDGYADNLSFTTSAAVTPATLTAPATSVPGYDHVFFVMMENENAQYESVEPSAGYIYGNSAAPYINNTLVPMGLKLNQMYATTHPSDPNYLAVAGGSVSSQAGNPAVGSVDARNLADNVEAAGKTWRAYNDGANGPCDLATHGYVYPDDEPFTLYKDVATDSSRCANHIFPLIQITTDLASTATTPNFVWFAADDYNDMEQGGIAPGDTWLKNTLPTIFNSPAWKQQRSLLIVTWDEGYTKSYGPNYPNQVATMLIGSQGTIPAGSTSDTRYNGYSLGRTIENALGLGSLTPNDAYATPVNDAWAGSGTQASTLTTSTPSVPNGSNVTFNYSTPAATNSSTNWVGIYKVGDTPGTQSSTDWKYTPGTSGTVTFTANYGPGTYKVYLFYNDGYSALAGPVTLTLN